MSTQEKRPRRKRRRARSKIRRRKFMKTSYGVLFGRLVSSLRSETDLNQIKFASKCRLSSGALARVESGRNTATIDQIALIERALYRANVLDDFGDLSALLERCRQELRRSSVRTVTGKLEDGPELCPVAVVDRVVGKVVLEWQNERKEDDDFDFSDDDDVDFADDGDEFDDDDYDDSDEDFAD